MKYDIIRTSQFKKDYGLAQKKGLDTSKILDVISMLANGITLPKKYQDHSLSGNYRGCRDCHIEPDWILIYKIDKEIEILELRRTGSHSDLFK